MSELTPLQRLHRIQAIDLNLDRLRAEEGNFPDDLRAARAEQDRLNNDLEDTEITLEGFEKKVRQHELDLASLREQLARAREDQEKMPSTRVPRASTAAASSSSRSGPRNSKKTSPPCASGCRS